MVDVHLMKTPLPYGAFHIDLGLSPMSLSCPIAGKHLLKSPIQAIVRVTRP